MCHVIRKDPLFLICLDNIFFLEKTSFLMKIVLFTLNDSFFTMTYE